MKRIFAYILIFSFLSTILYAAEIKNYNSNYKGLHVGLSTKDDAVQLFGKPRDVFKSAYVKYVYQNIHITFNPSTGIVNSIIIYDMDYIDMNGISIGSTFFDVESLPHITFNPDHPEYSTDFKYGIIYWFENEKVKKIILSNKLKKNS